MSPYIQVARRMNLRPIDTAPRDGTVVVVAVVREGRLSSSAEARHGDYLQEYGDDGLGLGGPDSAVLRRGVWIRTDGGGVFSHPTHWRPRT